LAPFVAQHDRDRNKSDRYTHEFLITSGLSNDSQREREYQVYDSYFRIYRSNDLTLIDFLDQFLELYQRALLDIQFTELPNVEFESFIRVLDPILTISLNQLNALQYNHPEVLIGDQSLLREMGAFWESRHSLHDEAEKRDLAFYRWFCGHQLWNCVLNFLTAHLEFSQHAIATNSESAFLTTAIEQSCDMVRGFTSVLWYTMNFPSYLYQKYISKAMEAHSREQGSRGLSGTQGLDFRQYKSAINAFTAAMLAHFGKQRGHWPSELYSAFEHMQNEELLFHEHHIILSQQKIQLNYESILQRLASESQQRGMRISAMDAMRDMRDAKRKRIKKLFE
jgi:hypothetical protein